MMLEPQRFNCYDVPLGKGEVECSIHSVGTTKSPPFLPFSPIHIAPDVSLNAEPCKNMRPKRCSSRGKSGEYVPRWFGRMG